MEVLGTKNLVKSKYDFVRVCPAIFLVGKIVAILISRYKGVKPFTR